MSNASTPVRPLRVIVKDSGDPGYTNQLMVGTPCTGLVRVEWVAARYGQLIPLNWSLAAKLQVMESYMPLRYQVADAQNLICAEALHLDMEWLLLVEHDVVLPPDAFVRFNRYMRDATVPVVSGLYFSRAYPSEPMVFRGRGTGAYEDFKIGDRVWVDGVPTGCLLIHTSIIRAMAEESDDYSLGGVKVRRIFETPRESYYNPETGYYNMATGTSDLEWCQRVIKGDYLRKAGWAVHTDQYPFLVDTGILCGHIGQDGVIYPDKRSLAKWEK